MKRAVHGCMRAYGVTPEAELLRDESRLRRWAEREGYELVRIHREEQEGSIAGLTELIRELQHKTDGGAVVVPSWRHFGDSPVLREHLAAHLVDRAGVDLYEAGDR